VSETCELHPPAGTWTLRTFVFAILIPVVLSIAFYVSTFRNGYTYDDKFVLFESKGTRNWGNLKHFFTTDYYDLFSEQTYRPAVSLTYMFDYSLAGLNRPYVYHVTNVILHAIAVALVGSFAYGLIRNAIAAFLAALVFGLHPIQSEVVNSLSFREDILCAIFLTGMLLFYSEAIRRKMDNRFYALALGCAALAMLSKEIAVMAAIAIVAYEQFFAEGRISQKLARRWLYVLGVAVICGLILVFAFIVISNPVPRVQERSRLPYGWQLFNLPVVILQSFFVVLFPVHMSSTYSLTFLPHLPDAISVGNMVLFGLGCALIISWLVSIWLVRRRRGIAFGMLWVVLFLIPVSNILGFIINTNSARVDRFLYVPMIGIALAVASVSNSLKHSHSMRGLRASLWIVLCLVVVCWGIRIQARNADWHNDYSLFSAAVKVTPGSQILHNDLSQEYAKRGEHHKEIVELRKSIALGKTPEALTNLGSALARMGNHDGAKKSLRMALELDDRYVQALTNMGMVYQREADLLRGKAKSLRSEDRGDEANGFDTSADELYEEALAVWEQAIDAKPGFTDARFNIGNLLFKLGKTKKARDVFEDVLKIEPESARSHLQLGLILISQKEAQRGCEHILRARQLARNDRVRDIAAASLKKHCSRQPDLQHLGVH